MEYIGYIENAEMLLLRLVSCTCRIGSSYAHCATKLQAFPSMNKNINPKLSESPQEKSLFCGQKCWSRSKVCQVEISDPPALPIAVLAIRHVRAAQFAIRKVGAGDLIQITLEIRAACAKSSSILFYS